MSCAMARLLAARRHPRIGRGVQRGAVASVILLGGIVLSACSSSPSALGSQACADVAKSIALLNESVHAHGSTRAALVRRAVTELNVAQPQAAAAAQNSSAGQALAY